jgi:hypothetical protein
MKNGTSRAKKTAKKAAKDAAASALISRDEFYLGFMKDALPLTVEVAER